MSRKNNFPAFTLVEITIIVGIIIILMSVFLASIINARHKARFTKYKSYTKQLYKMIEDMNAVESVPDISGDLACLGDYSENGGRCWQGRSISNPVMDAAIKGFGNGILPVGATSPDGDSTSDYGVAISTGPDSINFYWSAKDLEGCQSFGIPISGSSPCNGNAICCFSNFIRNSNDQQEL